jgi:hypothetical protein
LRFAALSGVLMMKPPVLCAVAAGGGAALLGEGVTADLDAELDEAAAVEREKMKAQFRPEDLVGQYAIKGEFVCCVFRGGGGG